MNTKQANQLINKINTLENRLKGRPRRQKKARNNRKKVTCCLSKCAIKYLRARENPFSGAVSCVPTEFSQPSQKIHVRIRGTFQSSSTTGVASITAYPLGMTYNDGTNIAGGFAPAVVYTTPLSTSLNTVQYSDVGAQYANSPSPYSANAFGAHNLKVRIVSCGLRVRNATPMMYRGGNGVILETPDHSPASGRPMAGLFNFATSSLFDINGGWNSVVFHPIDPEELDYNEYAHWNNQIPYDHETWCPFLAATIQAPVGEPYVAQTFEYEVACCFEAIGVLVTTATPSESDTNGLSFIQNVTSSASARKPKIGERDAWVDTLLNKMSSPEMLTTISGVGVAAAGAGINSAINRLNLGARRPDYIYNLDEMD